ncbi:hypothetical protein MTP04_30120 [Lysinibacillus sp. PLM2]|nr:hypothetical protein MTP04_30120 [Lysinibacillus sp. PLM2]
MKEFFIELYYFFTMTHEEYKQRKIRQVINSLCGHPKNYIRPYVINGGKGKN